MPDWIKKCSKIGPITKTGRKVRAPIISTIIAKIITNITLAVGKRDAKGVCLFCASDPAIAIAGKRVKDRPASMAIAVAIL